jgi:hypothetical protein
MVDTCNTLWIGESLGAVERACLMSVLRQGHRLRLYCYEAPPVGVPEGVEIADAGAILPADLIVKHRRGSPSLFSNRFRYELQQRGLGTWIDADVYLLAPIPMTEPYLFGMHDETRVNGAILRLPQDCPMLPRLLEIFEERTIPPWLPPRSRLEAWWRLRRTGRVGLGKMPWGVTGPSALTALARECNLLDRALGPEVFYPVPPASAGWIVDPDVPLELVVSSRTVGVHLWNEAIRSFKDCPAPHGTFLARLQSEGARAG